MLIACQLHNSTHLVSQLLTLGTPNTKGGLDSGVNQYLGMRYASPPVRNLRFRAPAEPLTTTSLQNATAVSGYFLHLMVTR
jgi:carboxylesterase type B